MSPSLREALASLTSDRRFAEITASFNGMNLRQRFPNLTREEQAEIVRAARKFVQNQPEPQARADTAMHSRLEPPQEAALDLRASPPPVNSAPESPPHPQEPLETVGDVWVADPEPYKETYPAAVEPAELMEEERYVRHPGGLLRRPLMTGLAVLVLLVIAWVLGRQIMGTDPDGAGESVVEQPFADEKLASAESTATTSAEPAYSAEPELTNKPDPDQPAEQPPTGLQADATANADPEPLSAEDIQAPPKIPADLLAASPEVPDPVETGDSDTSGSMASSAEKPIAAEITAVGGNAEGVSVETEAEPGGAQSVATLQDTSQSTNADDPPDTKADVEDTPESSARQRATASDNPMVVGQIQARLRMVGYDPGPIDGVLGPRTRAAIRAFQQERGLRVDGEASELLLGILATYSGLQDAATQPATQ